MSNASAQHSYALSAGGPTSQPKPPKISSADLMQGLRKITIDHEGIEYTLHLTRQNKLLLTK